jgi:hypothetical protein
MNFGAGRNGAPQESAPRAIGIASEHMRGPLPRRDGGMAVDVDFFSQLVGQKNRHLLNYRSDLGLTRRPRYPNNYVGFVLGRRQRCDHE